MDPEIKDLVLRSRPIVLELLEARGYDTTTYLDQAPSAVYSLAMASQNQTGAAPLKIRVKRQENAPPSPYEFCEVIYLIFEKIKATIQRKEFEGDGRWEHIKNPENTDYIFILGEPYHESFDLVAGQAWQKKVKISFFHIKQLILNPSKHVLVPKHERVLADGIPELKKQLNLVTLNRLPFIKYHIDMQARWLGLTPGEVIKITRPSPTAGMSEGYRLCIS
jgi:DNA-directed RNA polymerase subunit H (RpoH/RPB5)